VSSILTVFRLFPGGKFQTDTCEAGRCSIVARYFLDRVALAWILVFLPASSLLILHHRSAGPQMGRFHLLGYGLINALLLFEAWSLTNCGEKSSFYVNHEWRRKIVGMLALPIALVSSNLLFPVMFEGYRKPEES
jgi:hypothetical protein